MIYGCLPEIIQKNKNAGIKGFTFAIEVRAETSATKICWLHTLRPNKNRVYKKIIQSPKNPTHYDHHEDISNDGVNAGRLRSHQRPKLYRSSV